MIVRRFIAALIGVVVAVAAGLLVVKLRIAKAPTQPTANVVTTFEECVAEGNPVMESYPRQCRSIAGQGFTEDIGNVIEKMDLVRLTAPLPNVVIGSPLTVTGEARGTWFFEASFPVVLVDSDGVIIAEGIAQADGEWMTEDFVPFTATVTFTRPAYGDRGSLLLRKDNPSGLPEHDDALEIPIRFQSL
ncbi:MAG: Gmad2 immunoglobulin-like domain-containing protein [Patescibacteria group bacterium]